MNKEEAIQNLILRTQNIVDFIKNQFNQPKTHEKQLEFNSIYELHLSALDEVYNLGISEEELLEKIPYIQILNLNINLFEQTFLDFIETYQEILLNEEFGIIN